MNTSLIVDVIDDMPMIGIIHKIVVLDDRTIIFCLNIYKCTYDAHYRAYILSDEMLFFIFAVL